MSSHRLDRVSRTTSVRVRAVLCLGLLLGVFVTGTHAFWTDDVVVGGSTFTAGTIDLKVNDLDAVTTSTLGMGSTILVPGATSAEVFTVKNAGTAALKYSLTGGLTGTDASTLGAASALRLTVVLGGVRSVSGSYATCTGGTTLVNAVALTSTTSTGIIATPRGPLAEAAAESLCFQVDFDSFAASSLQGTTATATFTLTGTSDLI